MKINPTWDLDEVRFRTRLETHGVRPDWASSWRGIDARYRVVCPDGHSYQLRPRNVRAARSRAGGVSCPVCTGSGQAWERFISEVSGWGAQVLSPSWLGASALHEIKCRRGHEVMVRPSTVSYRGFTCHACAGQMWDAAYVVRNPDARRVKFGASSSDSMTRLAKHRQAGFEEVLLCRTGLPIGFGLRVERTVRSVLKSKGLIPVQGSEYFADGAQELILSTARETLALAGS